MAMSSFRVMGVCAPTGFAAGVTAAMAIQRGCRIDELDPWEIRGRLRAAGTRLDLAPYANYLRRRRGMLEVAVQEAGSVGGVAVRLLPDGDMLLAWTRRDGDGWALSTAVRHEELWSEAQAVASADGPTLVLWHDQRDRLFAEGIEGGDVRPVETDEPPMVHLAAGSLELTSHDAGRSWQIADGLPEPPSSAVALVPSPGDTGCAEAGPLLVRFRSGGLETSSGMSWSRALALEEAAPEGPAALESSAVGLVVAFADRGGGIRVWSIPSDRLSGEPEGAVDGPATEWHHDDRSWLELLKRRTQPAAGR